MRLLTYFLNFSVQTITLHEYNENLLYSELSYEKIRGGGDEKVNVLLTPCVVHMYSTQAHDARTAQRNLEEGGKEFSCLYEGP
jgi:hypothetical protein